jgi:uncharacterized membrane protein
MFSLRAVLHSELRTPEMGTQKCPIGALFSSVRVIVLHLLYFNILSLFFCLNLQASVSWLLFGEKLPALWWFGSSLIVCGLVLIHHGSQGRAEPGLDLSDTDKKTI